jgi:hypothetical protein
MNGKPSNNRKAQGEGATDNLVIRINPDDKARIKAIAKREGLSLNEWALKRLLAPRPINVTPVIQHYPGLRSYVVDYRVGGAGGVIVGSYRENYKSHLDEPNSGEVELRAWVALQDKIK